MNNNVYSVVRFDGKTIATFIHAVPVGVNPELFTHEVLARVEDYVQREISVPGYCPSGIGDFHVGSAYGFCPRGWDQPREVSALFKHCYQDAVAAPYKHRLPTDRSPHDSSWRPGGDHW